MLPVRVERVCRRPRNVVFWNEQLVETVLGADQRVKILEELELFVLDDDVRYLFLLEECVDLID